MLAVIAGAVALGCQLPFAALPFAFDMEGSLGALFAGPVQKNYHHFGFLELRGAPVRQAIPTDPPVLEIYARHPPLRDWLIWMSCASFGLKEWAIRLLSIVSTTIAAGCLALRASRHGGLFAAIASIVLFPALPIVFLYGRMPSFEEPVLAFGLLANGLLPSTGGSKGRLVSCAALVFLATATDVGGPLILCGLFVQEWLATRRLPRLLPFTLLTVAASAGVALWVWCVAVWTHGGVNDTIASLMEVGQSAQAAGIADFFGEWPATIGGHFLRMFGIPVTTILVVAIGWAILKGRRSDPKAAAFILGWTLIGALWVSLFPLYSRVHEFWLYYFIPAAVFGASVMLSRLAATGRVGLALASAALVATIGWSVVTDYRREAAVDRYAMVDSIEEFNSLWDEDTLVYLLSGQSDSRSYYFRPWVVAGTPSLAEIDRGIALFRDGKVRCSRLVIVGANHPILTFNEAVTPALRSRLLSAGFTERPVKMNVRNPWSGSSAIDLTAFTLAR